jgi:hypothetical protein
MISVYSTGDGRARCIRFDDDEPGPRDGTMRLVTRFPDDELREALVLLARLGRAAAARRAKARPSGRGESSGLGSSK